MVSTLGGLAREKQDLFRKGTYCHCGRARFDYRPNISRITNSTMIIKITPMGAPRQTQRDKWQRRPVIVRYHAYRDELNLQLPGYELGLSVNLIFHIEMPKSWSKKRRAESIDTLHDQKPDIDNLAKGFMDAFHSEDKHVAILRAEKYWADEGSIEIL